MRIFKGNWIAVTLKVILVTLAMTTLGFCMMLAFGTGDTGIAIFIGICIVLLAIAYLTKVSIPLKFFAPGLMFLAAFVIVPVVFTLSMAGFKYQTGNMLSKEEAVSTIVDQGTQSDENGTEFEAVLGYYGKDKADTAIITSTMVEETVVSNKPSTAFDAVLGYYDGDKTNLAVLGTDTYEQTKYEFFLSTKDAFTPLTSADVKNQDGGRAVIADGDIGATTAKFKAFTKDEIASVGNDLMNAKLKYEGLNFIVVDLLPVRGVGQVSVREVSKSTKYKYFLASGTKYYAIPAAQVTANEQGRAIKAPNFTVYTDSQIGDYADTIGNLRLKYKDPYFLRIDGLPAGGVVRVTVNIQSLYYDKKSDSFSNVLTGITYKDDGRGNFRNPDLKTDYLEPGWKEVVWFENFSRLFNDAKVREPLIQVFIWTLLFAVITVFTQFALGLLVALAMDKKIRGRNAYRSLMILPYAMPSIMSILIWAGMLDDQGAINGILGTDLQWLHTPFLARVSVLIVNLWLGFPYFYLISAGTLQAIPKELAESASIDGAHPRQIFRLITLPLLLRMLAPLLIASFAFNFNNFNIIYLLTGGGPSFEFGGIAGATDILISYTYKIAFGSSTQDYGLASAISVVIFIIVASISMYGIRKSKVLDDFA